MNLALHTIIYSSAEANVVLATKDAPRAKIGLIMIDNFIGLVN